MPARPLARIPVPPGPDGVAGLLEPLSLALSGAGPAITPIPTISPTTSSEYVAQLLRATRPADSSAPLEHDEIAVVLATSGSTQNPKGVLHSASTLTALSKAAMGATKDAPQWIAALPVTSMGGLNVLIRALESGLPPVAVASVGGAGPFTPEVFVRAHQLACERSTDVRVSLVAAQLRRLLADDEGVRALQQCAQILVGGGPLPLATAEAAQAADITITTTYGATETAGGCVFNGKPLDGVRVTIDPRDSQILLSGPMIALGYRCEPELTARQFANGDYRTGDLGSFDSVLVISGRADDVVTVNGVNVAVNAVENALSSVDAVQSCAVIAGEDGSGERQLFAAVTLFDASADLTEPNELRDRFRSSIRTALGAAAVPRYFAFLDTLPMLPNGKVDRLTLTSLIGDGVTWQR